MFVKYHHIENHYNTKELDRIRSNVPKDTLWVMTEKADGANFAVIGRREGEQKGEEQKVSFAKRTRLIPDSGDETFFNFTSIREDLTDRMSRLMEKYPDHKKITVYGELIGCHRGFKNQAEIRKLGSVGNIPYTSKRAFLVFDMTFDNIFQDWDLVETCGFEIVPVIMKNTLEECLKFDIENFRTRIPLLYQEDYPLPEFPFSEGVVIKPYHHILHKRRAILKMKHSSFSDCKPVVKQNVVDNELDELLRNLLLYVTNNRLHSVISKEPSLLRDGNGNGLVIQNKEKFLALVILDVFDTYKRDGNYMPDLNKKDLKFIHKNLREAINKLVVE